MRPAKRQPDCATLPLSVVGSAVWFLRWLLVLLLVADQVGSPLHRHHHDSGIDVSAIRGHHTGAAPTVAHIEDDDHEPSVFHAVTTLRAESRATAQGVPGASDSPLLLAFIPWLVPHPDVVLIDGVLWATAAAATPAPPLHRSLPPDGRAPPAHA